MPNCFALTRKSDPQAGHVKLATIDDELCAHLEVAPNPKHYFMSWVDIIGFALACGKSFEQIRADMLERMPEGHPDETDADRTYLKIIDWLNANFTSDAWYQHKF